MTAKEYKQYKGLRKESLRDNMSDIEIALADIGELTTRELAKKHKPKLLKKVDKLLVILEKILKQDLVNLL